MKVLLLGATGKIGRDIYNELRYEEDIELSVMVRNPNKMEITCPTFLGSADDVSALSQAMSSQEILVASLDGKNILQIAQAVVKAAKSSGVSNIIWLTGFGIHNEIKVAEGLILKALLKARPEYAQAADVIANSGLDYALLRLPNVIDGPATAYHLTEEGQKHVTSRISRATIAKVIKDILQGNTTLVKGSIGVTQAK